MTNEPILVLGATGKTGRRIVERLNARGVAVRAGSRSSDPPFDWEDRATWGPALAGAGSVYISYFPDIAVPGAPATVGALAEQARDAGARRVVLLSGRGEEEAQKAERLVQDAGLEWTVVRCSWFNQNFSEGYMVEPIRSGEVAMPAGDMPEPFVDADDIADVAVAALIEEGHAGQVYELTGPRALTFAQAVEEIANATGRELTYSRVSMNDYAAVAAEQDVPDDVIWLLRYLFTEVLDGRNVETADGVQRALGREPRDFSEFAREAAATGVWNG
jgi:uncharacterized protein YbjT (DUF2867 family)